MTHRIRPVVLVLCLAVVPATTWAQGLVIDLAAIDAGKTHSFAIAPRSGGTVTIINLLPAKHYSYDVRLVHIPIAPLPMPGDTPAPAGAKMDVPLCSRTETFVFARLTQGTLKTEQDVAREIEKLLAETSDCPTLDHAVIRGKVLAEATRLTVRTFPAPGIFSGQQLDVVIKEDKRTWTVVFSTGARGSWRALSAFAFTPDLNDTFHTTASGSVFQIVHDTRGSGELSFVPSVLFTWLPAERENTDRSHGFTVGLGFGKTTPSVLGGYQWTFNQNIGLAAGIMAQRQTRLAREYEGDTLPTVKEALKPSQLIRETYRLNVFVAMTIRLDKLFSGLEAKAEPKK